MASIRKIYLVYNLDNGNKVKLCREDKDSIQFSIYEDNRLTSMVKVYGYSLQDRDACDKLVYGACYLLELGHIESVSYSFIVKHHNISIEVNTYPTSEGVIILGEGFAEQENIPMNDVMAIRKKIKKLVTEYY